jgi:SAM-dependent methyltransferase
MGLRSRLRNLAMPVVFAGTPVLGGLLLSPLRLLDLIAPGNGFSFAVARAVDRIYPRWFHRTTTEAGERRGDAYLAQRRASARTNASRWGCPLRAERFLEVGCGTGAKLAVYAEVTGARVVAGCDVDLASLRFGIEHGVLGHGGNPSLVHAPPYVLPFRDGVFDLVLCEEVLEHVPEPERLLAEIRRVLAPGGRALFLIGPMYLHAKGPHLQSHVAVLWPHVLFSRSTLERLVRAAPPGEDLLTHDQVWDVFRTLNGHGEGRYRSAVNTCGLTVERFERSTEYPALAALPLLGAFYRKNLRVVLRKD